MDERLGTSVVESSHVHYQNWQRQWMTWWFDSQRSASAAVARQCRLVVFGELLGVDPAKCLPTGELLALLGEPLDELIEFPLSV
jgi:hypothetical protein